MIDDGLEALRANLARHTGPARARPLVELGLALADRHWRAGLGTPAAKPCLDEAIQLLAEAYDYFEAGEFIRGQVASLRGWLLGIRHAVHGGSAGDREDGIRLLDEALTFPQLPQMLQILARLVLGELLLSRVTASMQSGDFAMRAMRSELSGEEAANADRAVRCLRQVVDGPATSAEVTSVARLLLGVAEAVQTLTGGIGGGPGGFDLNRMMQALTTLGNVQQQAAMRPPGAGPGFGPNIFDLSSKIALTDSVEWPVAVVDGPPPATAEPARSEPPQPSAPPRVPAATFRTALLGKLPGSGFAAVLTLLGEGAPAPDVHTVDELIALGSSLVEAPGAVGTDHLLFAVALHLRDVVDGGGGWDDGGDGDVHAAGDSLLAAAHDLLAAPADAVAVAFRLATLLDERRPALDIRTRLSNRFATVTEALSRVGADGLVYPTAREMLLLSTGTGRFGYAGAGSPLPVRVLVAGDGPALDESAVSYVRSGAHVIELANRTRRPLTEAAVFVASPRRNRQQAAIDAMLLRRTFYPRSAGLGQTVENADGAGTPEEVRARLDAVSMLHLGCGITADGGLELAGPAVLDPAEIATGTPALMGGLAVLPPTATGAAALAEALLASRFVSVIGFRDPVPDPVASIMYFLLHAQLVDEGADPASAVRAVRHWLADPHRKPPEHLPIWYEAAAAAPELADPAYRAALVHYGI